MDPRRILIVESEQDFALSIAAALHDAGFQSTFALDGGEAQRELENRKPDLAIVRAELPDQSGFSLCGMMKKGRYGTFPVILLSSESTQEAFSAHQATPAGADGYLHLPFTMESLISLIDSLLNDPLDAGDDADVSEIAVSEVSSDDGDIGVEVETTELAEQVDDEAVEVEASDFSPGESDGDIEDAFRQVSDPNVKREEGNDDSLSAPVMLTQTAPTRPPPVPKKERKSAITEEDRAFLDRCFNSIVDRKAELLAEAKNQIRRTPKRELLSSPEGKLQLLREELKNREAQLARISEIWGTRERELLVADDRLHEKDVEIQGLKQQVDELLRRFNEAQNAFVRKEHEHGVALDDLLQQKFVQEKDLIEVVAGKEKEINLLKNEMRHRDEELSSRVAEIEQARDEHDSLDKQYQLDVLKAEMREKELLHVLAVRENEICGLADDLNSAQEDGESLAAERDARLASLERARKAAEVETSGIVTAKEYEIRELSQALEGIRIEFELLLESSRREAEEARALNQEMLVSLGEVEEELADSEHDRETMRCQRDGVWQSLSERIEERDERISKLEEKLKEEQERAIAQESELSTQISADLEKIGELEGELEAVKAHGEQVEAELSGQIQGVTDELERARGDLAIASAELEERTQSFADLEAAKAQSEEEHEKRYAALEQAKLESEQAHDELYAELEREKAKSEAQRDQRNQELLEAKNALEAELSGKIDSLVHELNDVRATAAAREQELNDVIAAHQDRIRALEIELADLNEEKQRTQAEYSSRVAELEKRLLDQQTEYQARQQELIEEIGSRDERIADLVQQLEALRQVKAEETENYEKEISELRGSVAGLEESFAKLEIEKAQSDAANQDQIASNLAKIGELQAEVEITLQTASQREDELNHELRSAGDEIANLKHDLEQAISTRELRESELAKLEEVLTAERDEHSATRQEKAEREADLQAARKEVERLERELADKIETAQAETAQLLQEVDEFSKQLEEEKKGRAFDAAAAATRAREYEERLAKLIGERDLAREMGAELELELGETKTALGTREGELTHQRAHLAEAETRVASLEERLEAMSAELARREELLQKDLAARNQELSDEKRKREQIALESRRSQDAMQRELSTRTEQNRVLEATLAAERDKAQRLAQDTATMRTSLQNELQQIRGELSERTGHANELARKIDDVLAERETLRREMVQGFGLRDTKLNEMASAMASERAERRREVDELTGKLSKEAARAKDMAQAVEVAKAERAKLTADANEKLAARVKRVQELEQAVEVATNGKSRAERDWASKLSQAEAKTNEVLQRFQASVRERKEVEAKQIRELEEITMRHKAELDRKEQQRAQDVQRLQASVQEKAKALKVVELELARLKAKAGAPAPAAAPLPRPVVARSPVAARAAAPAASKDDKRPVAKAVGAASSSLPTPPAPPIDGKSEDDEWSNVVNALEKLDEG